MSHEDERRNSRRDATIHITPPKSKDYQTTRREPFRVNSFLPTKCVLNVLYFQDLESSEWIILISSVKVPVFFFSGRFASSIPVIAWSRSARVIAVSIP